MRPILIGDLQPTRIFRPSEFTQLVNAIPKLDNQVRVKVSLYTGMRIIELRRWHKHDHKKKPENRWYDQEKGFIYLPKGTHKKEKSRQKSRYVRLNKVGSEVVLQFLKLSRAFPGKSGDNATFNENIKRWCENVGLSTRGVCPKMFRKTYESWLFYYYPERAINIIKSQGHTKTTAIESYVELPFDESDKIEMKPYVEGWI